MNISEQTVQDFARLIGQRLATFRKHIDMSQQEVADQLGTTQNLIYRMENELGSSISMLLHICLYYQQAHHLNLEWLFNSKTYESEFAPMLTSADLSLRKQIGLADRHVLRCANELIRGLRKLDALD